MVAVAVCCESVSARDFPAIRVFNRERLRLLSTLAVTNREHTINTTSPLNDQINNGRAPSSVYKFRFDLISPTDDHGLMVAADSIAAGGL